MTVSSTINREQYSTDGVTTAFAIHFPFFDDTDVNAVYVDALGNPTPLALNADYTVSGGGGAGGTLTALAAPAGGGALTIYREIPFTQEDDYVEDDPLPADTLEGGFDRAVMRDQQLKDAQDRALTLPVTIPAGVSAVLPFPVVDSFLGWNATGTGLENKTLPDPSTLVKATPSQAVNGANDTAFMTPAMTKAALQGVEYDTGQVSLDAGAAEGPTDEQFRDSATPAAADLLGVRSWAMRSSTAVKRVAAKILGRIVDATNASEDAALDVHTIIAGTLARRFSIGAGLYADGLGDAGAGTVNAAGYSLNGMTLKPVVQIINSQTGAVATGTTQIPADDTIPQITEGTEFLTATITPKNAANILEITAVLSVSPSGFTFITAALFQDATAGALAVAGHHVGAGEINAIVLKFRMAAGTTSATTFRVRAGPSAAVTVTVNGASSARLFGGALVSSLTIIEHAA
jgi:hypothetical protein